MRCYNYSYEEVEYEEIGVAEESVEYVLEAREVNPEKKVGDKKHDKIFKDILQDKREMSKFISHFTKYKVKAEELELYNVNYITKEFKYSQADVVYKRKGKEIYYLVEHQTKVDYSMSYRILNYCIEIIRSVVKSKELNKVSYRYPIVVPIVLYTGNQKWEASTSFYESQVEEIDEKIIDVKYKLIDVNKYETEELLKLSPCRFHGPEPNEVGNFCIVGHNYRNSKFFSKVPNLENGDTIDITDLTGRTITYSVYDKYIVDPSQVECTDQRTNGQKEITLITCTYDSQNRVIVKAREIK